MGKKSELERVKDEVDVLVCETNAKIAALGEEANGLYKALCDIQDTFDGIRNIPTDEALEYERLKKVRLEWKSQAEKIEADYNAANAKNVGAGVAGVGLGVAVVAMGPTVAMGVATTFGVASTGTAISALSGAAATNAALAWLGGGALAFGGGGMAAGEAFLAMAGPIGWAIAGGALLVSGALFFKRRGDKKRLDRIFVLIGERDVKSYKLAIVELEERIKRVKNEAQLLRNANADIQTFGMDYHAMNELQQYALGAYVNLMNSSTQLLVNPILGLQPKYTEDDFEAFVARLYGKDRVAHYRKCEKLIVMLANLLYEIHLDESDRKLLWKVLRGNKDVLQAAGVERDDFDIAIVNAAIRALRDKYGKRS